MLYGLNQSQLPQNIAFYFKSSENEVHGVRGGITESGSVNMTGI